MNRTRTLIAVLPLLLLVGVAHAQEGTQDALLYGGNGTDEALAANAVKNLQTLSELPQTEPADWFLSNVPPLVGVVHMLGRHEVAPCEGEQVTLEQFTAAVEVGAAAWDELEFEEALAGYQAAEGMLGCLTGLIDDRTLSHFHFARAVAAYFQRPRNAQQIRDSFSDAHRTRPDLPWDPDYSYEPQKYFYETRDVLLRGGRARVWSTLPAGKLYVNGKPMDNSYVGNELLPGRHLFQVQLDDGVHTAWVRLGPAARVVIGEPDPLWRAVVDNPTGPALERSISARLGLGYAVAQDYWLSTQGGIAKVKADTGIIEFSSGSSFGIFRPYPWVEAGVGYLFHHPEINHLLSPAPTASWFQPRIGLGVQLQPFLGLQLGLGLAVAGPFDVEAPSAAQSERFSGMLHMFGTRFGLSLESPRGRVRPGARIEAELLFPGDLYFDRDQNFVDDTGGDVFAGPVAAFTLAIRTKQPLWVQIEAGGGWVRSWTASVQTRFQIRRK